MGEGQESRPAWEGEVAGLGSFGRRTNKWAGLTCTAPDTLPQQAGGADAVLPLLDVAVGAPGWPATSAAVNAEAARPVPVPGAFSLSRRFFVKTHTK